MITRNLDRAREAYKKKDSEASRQAHSVLPANASEEHHTAGGKYIKSVVYGGLDGIITTFAVVAGVTGAVLSPGIILILGFANLIADGLSMAVGDFLSSRAEREYNKAERAREEWEVDHFPEGEKREMEEIYKDKGFTPEEADSLVSVMSGNRDAWVELMMVEELGIIEEANSPFANALATFLSFVFFGFLPLSAYLIVRILPLSMPLFPIASVVTGLALFILGALKARFLGIPPLKAGLEMVFLGGCAAAAAYGVGAALSGLV